MALGIFALVIMTQGMMLALLATRDMGVSLLLRAAPRVEGVFPERTLLVRIMRVRLHSWFNVGDIADIHFDNLLEIQLPEFCNAY